MSKETLLLIADSPLGDTSYASVGKQLMQMLKDKYELYWGGLQYIGKPLSVENYTLLSFNNLQNSFTNLQLLKHVDHIIYIRNSWAIGTPGDPFRIIRPFSNDIILYTPVEERMIPKRFFKGLHGYDKENNYYDRIVTMTKTGENIIKNMGVECDYLYHNLNEKKLNYNKYENIQKNFLNISYSMDYRKNLATYMLIASKFKDFNFNWLGMSTYYVIQDYVEFYDIKNFNIINNLNNMASFNFLNDTTIAQIYVSNNFYIQTSFKEGFDLTVLEALSNGLITIMPGDPIHRELFYDYPNSVYLNGDYDYPAMNQLEYRVPLETYIQEINNNINRKKMGIIKKDRFSFDTVKSKLLKIVKNGD